jgi:hypothetical protein
MDVVGFEHEAKSPEEKNQVEEAKKKIQDGLFTALGLPQECKLLKTEVKVDSKKDSHAEWEVEAEVHCDKALTAQKIKIDFSTLFPKLSELNVKYVSQKTQTSHKLSKGQGELSFD